MFHVLYEKMSHFCANYDKIGDVTEQCGDGVHDPKKFQFSDSMMVPT